MKNTQIKRRKAFTIVELVIVIAVIAILAGVLIPTFGGIIKAANISADEQVAASLTTALKAHMMTETVDTEEELMAAIAAIDPDGKMLVPKALSYDYHFWFDMENQKIVSMSTEDVEKIGAPAQNGAGGAEGQNLTYVDVPHRPLLDGGSNDSIFDVDTYAGVRDIFNNKFFLIDSADTIKQLFGSLTTVTGNNYASYIANLSQKTEDKIYGAIIAQVIENLKKTIIFNNNGTFYYEGATACNVYFADGIEIIRSNQYVYNGSTCDPAATSTLPTPAKEINLPASVILVQEHSLDFGSGNTVVINTTLADKDALAGVLTPNSTDATVKDASGVEYKVTVGTSPYNGANSNILVLNDAEQTWKADLDPKVAFDEWSIGYGLTDSTQSDENASSPKWWYFDNENKILYVAYKSTIEFFVVSSNGERSDAVKDWSSSNTAVIDNNLRIVGGGETVITATVKGISGNESEQSITVRVNTVNSVNVKVENSDFNVNSSNPTHTVNWHYSGTDSIVPTVNGTINYLYNYAKGAQKLDLGIVGTDSMLAVGNNAIVRSDKETGSTQFTISVDGLISAIFDVNIIDNSQSLLQVNFYDKSEDDVYKYYIGDNNPIKLSALFGNKPGKTPNLVGATLNIYDGIDDDGVYQNINGLSSGLNATFGVTGNMTNDHTTHEKVIDGQTEAITLYDNPWTLSSGWINQVIEFTGLATGDTKDIWIQISPVNSAAIFIKFTLVDADNVSDLNDLKPRDDAGSITSHSIAFSDNVVLHGNCEIDTGTTIDVGAKTLYGNGYVITADTYVGTDTKENIAVTVSPYLVCKSCGKENISDYHSKLNPSDYCSKAVSPTIEEKTTKDISNVFASKDYYLIGLSGGTIDNVYIDGPVYPDLQYLASNYTSTASKEYADTAYYVSGIKVTGSSTILNSYVSGFRQPVQVKNTETEKVSVINTTLYGGNYANLEIVDGDVYLEDVTTIQEQNGSKPTVGDTSKNVIGLGIVRGISALNNNLTITGYLDQYNWIPHTTASNQNIKLPVLNVNNVTLDTNTLFDGIFNGYKVENVMGVYGVNVIAEAGSVKFAIAQDSNQNSMSASEGYVHVGIVFAQVGTSANSLTDIKAPTVVDRKEGRLPIRAISKVLDTTFSNLGVPGKLTAADQLGTDGRLILWGCLDNRVWDSADLDMNNFIGSIQSLDTVVIDNKLYFKRWSKPVDNHTKDTTNGTPDGIADIASYTENGETKFKSTFQIDTSKELNYDGYYYHDDTDNTKDSPYNNIFKPTTN